MKTASWIVLTLVTALLLLGSLASAGLAYMGSPSDDVIVGDTSLSDLSIADDASTALRGRRGTAAAFALAFGTLLLMVILGPYRQGSVWAWWAILIPVVVLALIAFLRVPTLGTTQGAYSGLSLLIGLGIGLGLGMGRLKRV